MSLFWDHLGCLKCSWSEDEQNNHKLHLKAHAEMQKELEMEEKFIVTRKQLFSLVRDADENRGTAPCSDLKAFKDCLKNPLVEPIFPQCHKFIVSEDQLKDLVQEGFNAQIGADVKHLSAYIKAKQFPFFEPEAWRKQWQSMNWNGSEVLYVSPQVNAANKGVISIQRRNGEIASWYHTDPGGDGDRGRDCQLIAIEPKVVKIERWALLWENNSFVSVFLNEQDARKAAFCYDHDNTVRLIKLEGSYEK